LCSDIPAWKQLITQTSLVADERISLITTIFSDPDQVEMVSNLSGGDAQAFVDKIDEASSHTISRSKEEAIDYGSNLHILPNRYFRRS
jgi:hypothetical protein